MPGFDTVLALSRAQGGQVAGVEKLRRISLPQLAVRESRHGKAIPKHFRQGAVTCFGMQVCICRLSLVLSRMNNLEVLDLGGNGLEALPESLKELDQIKRIDLSRKFEVVLFDKRI